MKRLNWGLEQPTFSNGVAYADFDNDGALDMVINNINDEALLYRNTSRDKDSSSNRFLQIKFKGDKQNINGLGALSAFIMIMENNRCMKIILTGDICPACRVSLISD